MIFLKPPGKAGQAFLETLLGITALLLVSLVGILILLQGIGTLIVIKWAGENSLCIAKQLNKQLCRSQTQHELQKYFALSAVQVRDRTTRGIIHTDISAKIAGYAAIHGSYDLGPSEYRRVSR